MREDRQAYRDRVYAAAKALEAAAEVLKAIRRDWLAALGRDPNAPAGEDDQG